MTERVDVIIAGAGPVGLGLAIELGQRGVRCLLIDREGRPQRIPKGQNLTNRTLEHFYFWGCDKALRAARRLPPGFPIRGITYYGDFSSPYSSEQGGGGPGRGEAVKALFYQAPDRLPQYDTEAVLRARLEAVPEVEVRRGWKVTGAEQSADRVTVTIEGADGAIEEVEADYLVGADGARSAVRGLAGITSTIRSLGDRMVLVVFRSEELEAVLSKLPAATTYRVLNPKLEGHWQFFGRVDGRDTFFFHSPVPADQTLEPEDLTALMNEAAGAAFEAEIEHAGFWDLRISIADSYRAGRMFIAGDACHSHPPYGGFGLNTGLEDARNLGWKLAATLRGQGGEALLDSYDAERRPVFVGTANYIQDGIARDRAFLNAHAPERNEADFRAAWDVLAAQGEPPYHPHYTGSPVIAGGPALTPGVNGLGTVEAVPGQHLAPALLSDGRNVYEALGAGFHLLAFGAADGAAAIRAAAYHLALPLAVTEDDAAGPRAAYGWRLILVRPDQYVAWAGDAAPRDVRALLAQTYGVQA
jgi:4-hydroxyisophthalate hydroxylase